MKRSSETLKKRGFKIARGGGAVLYSGGSHDHVSAGYGYGGFV